MRSDRAYDFQLRHRVNIRGLMELVVLNVGCDLGILSQRIFTMLVIMAVITTMMTAPLLTLLGVPEPSLENDRQTSRT